MSDNRPLRVVHISTGLNPSGAEYSLFALLNTLDRTQYEWLVVGLIGRGVVGERIKDMGIRVVYLEMPRRKLTFNGVTRLLREVLQFKPDILHGWMFHGSLATAVCKLAAPKAALVWSVRRMPVDAGASFSPLTLMRLLQRIPRVILFNSQASADAHAVLGFSKKRLRVIHNGFDVRRFQPDVAVRVETRQHFGISIDAPVIGMVGRYTPEKNYPLFAQAARLIAAEFPDVRFIFVGEQITRENALLVEILADNDILDRVHLLGRREDLQRIIPAFDLLALPSSLEGFPNVVGEAMACSVPCVVSNVSDNRHIVGETGIVIESLTAEGVADACLRVLHMTPEARARLGAAARARVIDRFSLQETVSAVDDLYRALVSRNRN